MKLDLKKEYQETKVIIRILIVIIAIYTLIIKEYGDFGISVLTMALTFFDTFLKRVFKIDLDEKLKLSLLLFIFGAQCMGSVLDFYGIFSWWDTMLHTISGILFFYIGICVLEQMNQKTNQSNIHPAIVILFGVCFSLAIGVVWELFEFAADSFLGANMQVAKGTQGQEAIKDTMIDLLSATVGTIIIAMIEGFKSKKIENKK